MDKAACPECKTTKYQNPSLKLLVNVCGHSLCENCVDLRFIRGTGNCPECRVLLRRNNFRVQVFGDPYVEKEVDIRKRILKDYNKKEEDFKTLREYNDYLEEVETIIFNLTNGIDIEATKQKVEDYKIDNKEIILRNKLKPSKDEAMLNNLIENQKKLQDNSKTLLAAEEQQLQQQKTKQHNDFLHKLTYSDLSADEVLETFRQEQQIEKEFAKQLKPASVFSTGIRVGVHDNFIPIPKVEDVPTFVYEPYKVIWNGPEPPEWDELCSQGYLTNVRSATDIEIAGGYTSSLAGMRALQSAFSGLFFNQSQLSSDHKAELMTLS